MFGNIRAIICFIFSLYSSTWLFAQPGHYFLRDTFCGNQTIFIGNQLFDPGNPSGLVTLPGAAFNGLDSVIHVDLTFNHPVMITLNSTHCEGDTVWVNGTPYHSKFFIGQEVVQEGAANGCDSIIEVDLHFIPALYDYTVPLCEGDSILINGHYYDAFLHNSGTESIPRPGQCDSILQVKIMPKTAPFSNLRDTLCPDEFYIINGTRYDFDNRAGYEILPNASSTGCDSIVAIDLEFRNLWVYIGEDREVVKGDTICITPLFAQPPVSVNWLPSPPCGDPDCRDNCIQLTASSTFTYEATDSSGCVLRDDIHFSITTKNRIYAPNVFAPDAHWPNNYFFLSCDRTIVNIKRLLVFDRWGDQMYEKTDGQPGNPEDGWDGKFNGTVMNPGVYVFWVELERYDGSTLIESGDFTLIR